MQRNSWERQYPALKKILLMTHNAEKNILHRHMREKNSNSRSLGKYDYLKITHIPLLHQRPMVMLTI